MQLLVDIKDESIAKKIIKLLEVFKNDGVEIKSTSKTKLDLERTKEEQEKQSYDVDYENSYQYKLDRAEFSEMKEKL